MIKEFVKNRINPVLRRFGGAIVPAHEETSLQPALGRIKSRGLNVETVIDVGASDGRWSEVVMNYYPQAKYFLVEAQDVHLEKLRSFKEKNKNVDFVLAAAGAEAGEVYFDASDPFGGVASDDPIEGAQKVIRVPVTTIDEEVKKRDLAPPCLIKLDTHGFELPILCGAESTLSEASVVIIEVYNFVIANGAIRFHEMISFMEERGFRVAGMCDPIFRRLDGVLWQLDLVFIRKDRPEFSNNSF